jgi:hypothetical protein
VGCWSRQRRGPHSGATTTTIKDHSTASKAGR